jgi:hypothetical protein
MPKRQQPTQSRMFATSDLPLFSMTAPRTQDSIFTEREPEPKQLDIELGLTVIEGPAISPFNHATWRIVLIDNFIYNLQRMMHDGQWITAQRDTTLNNIMHLYKQITS